VAARECWNGLSRARRWWRPVVRGDVPLPFVTPGLAATTLAKHGTEEQRRAILPGIVEGSVQFCLELTAPDAGSNVIAISSTARYSADFLLRGQTGVENADWTID
jgi:acyl-CoA dehydrogenase